MGNVSYALKWFKISTNFLSLVPMQLCDMHFISGKIDQDEFLAVLYQRDFDLVARSLQLQKLNIFFSLLLIFSLQ